MKTSVRARNVIIALFSTLLIVLLALQQFPVGAAPAAQINFVWNPTATTSSGLPGQSLISVTATLQNQGPADTFNIVATPPTSWPAVTIAPSASVNIAANASQTFTFFYSIPTTATAGTYAIDIIAARASAPSITALFRIVVNVTAPTATPTPTATITPTPSGICLDGFEPDNFPAQAKRIDVQIPQEHVICPTGDEDWLYFGGVADKVYTIDVPVMRPGIDLSLELLDSNLNRVAFNDDFFNRDPANPNPSDTRPRITVRIPADGRYYIRVRDTAGRGGTDYSYVIVLLDESNGPTPAPAESVCFDIFEPDGLPEQARLITSNEVHENRRLCPTGDADWVTFFAKAGKRYVIYTDTRRYRGSNSVNNDTQAGADTVLVLTDRDGVSILDINDDMPGGNTLDSQIEFTPKVDGFYFAQVKNVGDIGNQFIRYDLVLLLCLPGQTNCRRPDTPLPGQPENPATPLATSTPIKAPLVTDPTATPVPPTPTP
ncbi:PPC domain-containing protein [Chloroflexus sp.]|uniref:PPC domain-containing protein n=1 Tax=Chloroflexus sp. TaxID=1904827 RepID=UPI00298F24AE|nr:PPC domain-containing protein [Chloroflexus sp.]MDW8402901.1 PPC domain-containing protein [Chloroflexus sp.]